MVGLSRADAEALSLELRRLAKRFGIDIGEVKIERAADALGRASV